MVVHTSNPLNLSALGAEVGRSLSSRPAGHSEFLISEQPGLHRATLSQKKSGGGEEEEEVVKNV